MISNVTTEEDELIIRRQGREVYIAGHVVHMPTNTRAILLFRAVKAAMNMAAKDATKELIRERYESVEAEQIIADMEEKAGILRGTN